MQTIQHREEENRSVKEPGDGVLLRLSNPVTWSAVTWGKRLASWMLVYLCSLLVFLAPSAHAAQVTLTWEANGESNLGGYKVYYGTGSRDYDWSVDVGKVTTYTVSNLANGVTYYFASTAYTTSKEESTFSDEAVYGTCTYSISPTSAQFSASGGTGTVSVTTQTGCPWTASSGASWLTITSGGSGLGSGKINYSVAPNTATSSRTAVSTFGKQAFTVTQAAGTGSTQSSIVTQEANYSFDVTNSGIKHYHDGNDSVGKDSGGILRTATRWDISGIDPSWKIVSVEVRFYTESKAGSIGAISIGRYGSSHGEDNPQTDSGALAYSKCAGSVYASLPEPSAGAWTGWVNLGRVAVSDIEWCRDNGKSTWSVGLKASSTVEAGTTSNYVRFSEDNEAADGELRITYSK